MQYEVIRLMMFHVSFLFVQWAGAWGVGWVNSE
jgi:hypothetical protein